YEYHMKAIQLLHQKSMVMHRDGKRAATLEIVVWQVRGTTDYPEGIKYRAWFSEDGATLFGMDNHKPRGPHLHIRDIEVGYVFRGIDALIEDVVAMVRKEGFQI